MQDNEHSGIKVSASKPSLNDKILLKVDPGKNTVFWYIKFNILLDEKTITEKSMYVTDLAGYKMRTFIEYSEEYNVISISPIDTYSQNMYYILHITDKVKSKKGNRLKRPIHIIFKLVNNEISDYEVLKKEATVPKAVDRPKNYNPENVTSKVYGFSNDVFNKKGKDNLPYLPFKINPLVGISGLLLIIIAILLKNLSVAILGAILAFFGCIHLFMQLSNKEKRAVYIYNKGVRKFRTEDYKEAKQLFLKAQNLDPYNEVVEFAIGRVNYYIE